MNELDEYQDHTRRLDIEREGAQAKKEGKDRSDNPYISYEFKEAWNYGFDHPNLVHEG